MCGAHLGRKLEPSHQADLWTTAMRRTIVGLAVLGALAAAAPAQARGVSSTRARPGQAIRSRSSSRPSGSTTCSQASASRACRSRAEGCRTGAITGRQRIQYSFLVPKYPIGTLGAGASASHRGACGRPRPQAQLRSGRESSQIAICVVASAVEAARENSSAGSSIGARRTDLRSRA